jgi:hypothetical protein
VLSDPQAFGIRVIVMRLPDPAEPPDVVYGALHDSPRLKAYRLVYHSSRYLIYSVSNQLSDPQITLGFAGSVPIWAGWRGRSGGTRRRVPPRVPGAGG